MAFDWNDLRYFLAVAREGGTLAAARSVGVDATTVQRRIAELERRLGCELVIRGPTGYRLTEAGTALRPLAEQVAQAVAAFERGVAAQHDDLGGVVRVTCPEPAVGRLTSSGLIERFQAGHPGLRVEFVISDRYVDLMAGAADVALRSGDTDDGALVGRKIADSYWAVYASPAYLERHGRPASLDEAARHDWVGLDDAMGRHRVATWLQTIAPPERIVARTSSVLGLVYAAKSGVGLAALPTAIADADASLVRVLGPVEALQRIWRVLAAPDRRHVPRVAAFFDFVVTQADELQRVLGG